MVPFKFFLLKGAMCPAYRATKIAIFLYTAAKAIFRIVRRVQMRQRRMIGKLCSNTVNFSEVF